jgi:hypothetical protein
MLPIQNSRAAHRAIASSIATGKSACQSGYRLRAAGLPSLRIRPPPSRLYQRPCHQPPSARPRPPPSSRISSTAQLASRRRAYHSTTSPPPPGGFGDAENSILSAAYAHVSEHGFTAESLALGARDAGYLDISTNLLQDGPFSLIRWHLITQREALAGQAEDIFGSGGSGRSMGVGEKVEALTWARLMGNKNIVGRWQEVSFGSLCSLPFTSRTGSLEGSP